MKKQSHAMYAHKTTPLLLKIKREMYGFCIFEAKEELVTTYYASDVLPMALLYSWK